MKRVLIVDDEPHVVRVLKLSLQREGYEVDSAPNPGVALDKLRSSRPDVLITDVQMPGMSGRELCETLHVNMPDREFLILVMTSMAARENREWVSRLPNIEFLEKPLSPRTLLARLANYFAPAVAVVGG
jgi:CheY-like chemotaxis protein